MNSFDPHENITSPLGGRANRGASRAPGRRPGLTPWTGYRRLVRLCPACGRENSEHHLFCDDCAADLRSVPVTAANDGAAGRHRLVDMLARREDRALAHRRQEEGTGGGFLTLGVVLFVAAIWMTSDQTLRTLVWAASLVAFTYGLWRMRYDPVSLRRVGLIFGGASGAVLLLIASQSALFPRQNGAQVVATPDTPAGTAQAVSTPATPTAGGIASLRGEMRMYRGDPAHTGQQPGPAPAGQPAVAWRFETGGEVYASPAIADGVIYLTSKSGFLYAVDAGTGEQRWRYQLGDYVVRSSPAIVDGVVYVGGGFNLFAIDATTGQERWRFAMRYAGGASPTVVDGVVYVTSQEGFVYAVDARTGKERWNVQTEGLIFSSPTFIDGTVVVGTDSGVLYGVTAANGRLDWRRNLDGPIFASVAGRSDGVAFVTIGAGFTYAIDVRDGSVVWTAAIGSDEAPAVSNGTLVLSAKDGGVYGLDATTGTTRWLFPTGESATGAPSISDDLVFVGAGRNLLIIDASNGTRRWYFLASDIVESAPTVIDGVVLFGNRDGFLYAIGAAP
jgi:eukaryotic-like serine/threonine-protein kinase